MIYKEKINQYFKKHSTHLSCIHNYKVKKESYKYFIVIPIFNEYDYIFQTLKSIDKNPQIYLDELLVVLVINNSIDGWNIFLLLWNFKLFSSQQKYIKSQ